MDIDLTIKEAEAALTSEPFGSDRLAKVLRGVGLAILALAKVYRHKTEPSSPPDPPTPTT